jgi:transposase InsO family protein
VSHRPVELTQYTSIRFTEHLTLEGIAASIGLVGDAYDNALMESVIGLFKTECVTTNAFHHGPMKTLHASLGMLTPAEYEQAHYAGREPRAATRARAAQNP